MQHHITLLQNKLQLLSTDDSKHDSGLDPDLSTSSVMELDSGYQGHRTKQTHLNTTQSMSKSIHTYNTHTKKDKSSHRKPPQTQPKQVTVNKNSKKSGVLMHMKNIINRFGVTPKETKDGLNPNVTPTLTSEYEWRLSSYFSGSTHSQLSEPVISPINPKHAAPHSFSSRHSSTRGYNKRISIAGSIVDSFGLQNNDDNLSYISGFLSCSSYYMPAGYVNDGYSYHGDYEDDLDSIAHIGVKSKPHIRVRCSSCESLSALHNDQLYPPTINQCDAVRVPPESEPRHRRKRKRSWKRTAPPQFKVYTVQMPKDPHVMATSGKAVTKSIGEKKSWCMGGQEYVQGGDVVQNQHTAKILTDSYGEVSGDISGNINTNTRYLDYQVALADDIIQHFEDDVHGGDTSVGYEQHTHTSCKDEGTFV